MAKIELLMPKMGESIIEATILKWVKKVGDPVSMDETILEIATDKVDSEILSPADGVITEILFPENSIVAVGKVLAYISTNGEHTAPAVPAQKESAPAEAPVTASTTENKAEVIMQDITAVRETVISQGPDISAEAIREGRFYSPLVKSIAKEENISASELDQIPGSGANNRVTKEDILSYVAGRSRGTSSAAATPVRPPAAGANAAPAVSVSGNTEIMEMDRMRKLIADHMVMSKHTSPHVTSFVEADVTNMVNWRERNKKKFQEKYGENITYTPLFIEAVIKALKEFPMVNVSLDGYRIIRKKDLNIGMAAALPSGNLIVPVIKNADMLSLAGLTKQVNDLARRARENKLKPEDIQDGTFTITNVGTFGNLMGTPIINQPQVAILATGAIVKKPAVIETEYGDVIAIRHMMFLSLSYDHRIVDGALGGSFLKRVSDHLERFDINIEI